MTVEYIAFDFETSGLPKSKDRVTLKTLKTYDDCRAVSLSAARFYMGSVVDVFDSLIYPEDFEIPDDSVAIHKITTKLAKQKGRRFKDVFRDFINFIGPTSVMVAHNAEFDVNVLVSEMLRHEIPLSLLDNLDFRCTLKLYGRHKKLGHIYKEIFGKDMKYAHNSLSDSIACGRIYSVLCNL